MRARRYMADVSSNNGEISIPHYSQAGHVAIAIKATEGIGYVNPYHLKQCERAHDFGLVVVHYHFCRPGLDNIGGEISNFRNTYLKGWRAGDIACFDLEVVETPNTLQYASSVLNRFVNLTAHKPWLYTYISFAEEHLAGLRFPGNAWWMAKYSSGSPTMPRGTRLRAWQYTDGSAGPAPQYYSGIGHSDGSVLDYWLAEKFYYHKLRTRKVK